MIVEFFARVKQVLLSRVSIQRCKKLSEHNYSTQTLSSHSSHVAGISLVMKHITINRPQMVSITKLYLTLRKKLFFVSVVLPIEKARSHCMTLGITEVILTGFTSSMHYFLPGNKFQFLPYSSRFFYLAFDNKLKANKDMKSATLLS